jgi:hypothetical protein
MRFKGFIGGSYTLQSVNVDSQRCINLYPEMDEMGTGNEGEVGSLVGTPGQRILCTLPTAPIRGEYTDTQGNLWAVGGNVLYSISSLWVATAVGTLNTSSGPVSMADNGVEVVLVDGPYGYSWTIKLSPFQLPASYTGTITTGGLTILTVASSFQEYFTGITTQTVELPVPTTMAEGPAFNVVNMSTGVVSIVDNNGNALITVAPQTQMVVTCTNPDGLLPGVATWTFVSSIISPNTFYQITDPYFLGASQVSFIDSYFIFNVPNSNEVYNSPENAVIPFDGTNVAAAESDASNVLGFAATQENLYFFKTNKVEIWYDNGGNAFPFQRIQGAVMEIGCLASFSIQKIQNSIYWLGQDATGRGVVYSASGLQPQQISTFAIETEIAKLGDLSGARAWSYSQSGHSFYCLNLPGDDTTWVFDIATNLWHERAYLSRGVYQRHLADCHAFAYSTNVVGDYSSGNLYALDSTVFTDNGNPIVRERSAPHISKDMMRIFHSAFQLDMEMGLGLNGTTQGTAPQAMLQWSNDSGHSWSNEHWVSVGAIGKRFTRAIWRRLGNSRDRVYRVRISDPVKVTLLGAQIDIEEGAA